MKHRVRTTDCGRRLGRRKAARRASCKILAVLIGVLVLLLGDGQADTSLTHRTSTPVPPIVIGVSNVQSGPSASLGKNLMQGSMGYFNVVNDRGGVYGRPIAVMLKDDGYEPDPAVRNTNELISNADVLFLFNYVGTPTLTRVLPLLKYYEMSRIVNVAPFTGADPQRTPPYNTYVFNIRASYRDETRALVQYLYGKGSRKIGLLIQADAYGKSGEVGVIDALASYGLAPVGIVTYRRNQAFEAEMTEQVAILRKNGADAVISIGSYSPCAAFIRDARQAGWTIPIANVSFVGPDALLETLRTASVAVKTDLTLNLINSQVVPSPSEIGYRLVRDYRAQMPPDAVGFTSLEGWLNAVVVIEALKRAGPNPTRSRFIEAMESLGGWDPGLGLKLAFDPTNHQGLRKVWLTKTEKGRWVPEPSPTAQQ
jgi:ABC-type branched-subunit amino acid transport system substrate-binding protein